MPVFSRGCLKVQCSCRYRYLVISSFLTRSVMRTWQHSVESCRLVSPILGLKLFSKVKILRGSSDPTARPRLTQFYLANLVGRSTLYTAQAVWLLPICWFEQLASVGSTLNVIGDPPLRVLTDDLMIGRPITFVLALAVSAHNRRVRGFCLGHLARWHRHHTRLETWRCLVYWLDKLHVTGLWVYGFGGLV